MHSNALGIGSYMGQLRKGLRTLVYIPNNPEEAVQYFTFQETLVVLKIHENADFEEFRSKHILHFTDGQPAQSNLTKG